MTKLHWLMLLAVGLAVGPRLYAAKVRAQERVDQAKYAEGACLTIITNLNTALEITTEDLEIAIWAIQQKQNRRRGAGRITTGYPKGQVGH